MNVEHEKQRRSKGEAILANFTDDPEKIGKNRNRRKIKRMADTGNVVPQHQDTEEVNRPQEEETEKEHNECKGK